MKKDLFLQYQQQLVEQLKTNIKDIEDINYEDYMRASEQSKSEGHEDYDGVAIITLFYPFMNIL